MKQTKASILYFMGPAMLLFCLIFIYPVSRTAIMSFFSVKSVTSAVSTWSWAGLDNYIKLFHTPLFITSVINIGKIWLYCGIACLGLAIALAIILTSGLRGQKFFRAIIYMPNVIAAVAVGIGYGSNITIRNITFRDCYNGHVIQVAGSDNVLIENCRFEGQSFRGSGDKTRELLQIEPGTVKGYPYTLVQNKAPSTNVTIRNCYFGGSENTPHYMAAIGTHSQQAGVKCSDIVIEDCTFDNAAYTAIHFMAYDRITIRNNIFTITSDSEQIDRYGILADTYGSFIDPTGAESTTDFTIEGNTFDVSDPKATVLEITTNNKSPKHIKNVTIKDNTLKGVNGGKAIDLYLLDNCTISGNTIEGFERPIVANSCDEQLISDTDIVTE